MPNSILKFTLVLAALFSFFHPAAAQQRTHQKVIAKYDSIRTLAPREKLYVHFDKHVYAEQDTISFKAYLLNATLHSQSTSSGLIYAEMLNEKGELVYMLSLPTTLGLSWGAIALKEGVYPAGKYTFRAYTNWMKNFGSTYIFSQDISVVSTAEKSVPTSKATAQVTKNAKSKATQPNTDIDIQFLPEGGTWLNGLSQKMAFKAINSGGKGITVQGAIYDSQQTQITTFNSNDKGMGYFNLSPKANEVYTAKVNSKQGDFVKILPKVQLTGVTLQVDVLTHKDSLQIVVNPVDANFRQDLTVIGQSRGVLCFIASLKTGEVKKVINLAKSIFPTGVSQVLVLNAQKQVLNERNFFLNLKDQLQIQSSTPMAQYASRDSIAIALKVTDDSGKPIQGSFSIAITADAQVAKDSLSDRNILNYLLMTSDLRGEIEQPGSYFQHPESIATQSNLEALMLTQGWVSYQWENEKAPSYPVEKEYTISGTITNVLNKPSVGGHITLMGKNNKLFTLIDTVTNAQGKFVFDKLPPLTEASFVIQAKNARGKSGTLGFTVEEFARPPIDLPKQAILPFEPLQDSTINALIASKKQVEAAAIRSGIALKEVKIVGKRSISGSKNLNGPGLSSQMITEAELASIPKKSLYELLLEKVKGFRVGGRPKSGERDFLINSDLAKFLIDGVELDFFYSPSGGQSMGEYYNYIKGYLDYYSAEDIKGIETMENGFSFSYKNKLMEPLDPQTYAFIEITTKTGLGPHLKKVANMYLIKPMDYGNSMVFYAPKYIGESKKNAFPDLRSTLYWHPNIMTNEKGETNFSFYAADQKGTYTVWIEGVDTEGGIGFKTMQLTIK